MKILEITKDPVFSERTGLFEFFKPMRFKVDSQPWVKFNNRKKRNSLKQFRGSNKISY